MGCSCLPLNIVLLISDLKQLRKCYYAYTKNNVFTCQVLVFTLSAPGMSYKARVPPHLLPLSTTYLNQLSPVAGIQILEGPPPNHIYTIFVNFAKILTFTWSRGSCWFELLLGYRVAGTLELS